MSIIIVIVIGVLLAALLSIWLLGERWRPLRPSTRKMVREAGLRRLLTLNTLHGYIYNRWRNQYIYLAIRYAIPRLGPFGKRWWSNRYHSKVLTHEQAEAMITIAHEIPLSDLEQIIPYSTARDLVLKGSREVVVYECACRHARESSCQPTQVCMYISQPFSDFALEHNPKTSRRITREEALELLKREHERGHVHSAWFKDACIDRFYGLCNCCKCCCGGIEAMVKYGVPLMASSGYVSQADKAKCSPCQICEDACPFGAIRIEETVIVNRDICMGCGVCVEQCPMQALSLVRDEKKGTPLDVRLLARGQIEQV